MEIWKFGFAVVQIIVSERIDNQSFAVKIALAVVFDLKAHS